MAEPINSAARRARYDIFSNSSEFRNPTTVQVGPIVRRANEPAFLRKTVLAL